MTAERLNEFKKNKKLENLLKEINSLLEPLENNIIKNYNTPRYPIILLVGCARSGSTLLMQWLAKTDKFSVPTNLLSRFYQAPYIGALIQQLLTNPEFDYKNELSDFSNNINFNSDLGKTKGALSPNEFYYFWRRFFNHGEIQFLNEKQLSNIDTSAFISELAAIESVFDKPFALKGLIINWNIPFVSNLFDNVLFIHIKRDPIFNAQSLLEARIKFYGDINAWYSFKPIEYTILKNLDPYYQVAGQVYYTNKAVEKGLNKIENKKKLVLDYEDFCKNPNEVYFKIQNKLAEQGYSLNPNYSGPESFHVSYEIKLSEEEFNKISKAYGDFLNT